MINLQDYPLFEKNKSTLKETSKNDSNKENISYMTESEIEVIDFDAVKEKYTCDMHLKETPTSNDALMEFDNELYFIEFKDGNISNKACKLRTKIFESLLIFSDITNETISFTREHMKYILVYNRENNQKFIDEKINDRKNANEKQLEKSEIQESSSFDFITTKVAILANCFVDILGLKSQFAKIYFKDVYTYDKTEFEDNFIKKSIINKTIKD